MKSYKLALIYLVLPLFFLSNQAFGNLKVPNKGQLSFKRKSKKRGEQGHRGFQGDPGPQGAQGVQGSQGAEGTGSFLSYFYAFAELSNNSSPIAQGFPITFNELARSSNNISIPAPGGVGTAVSILNPGFYEINFGAAYVSQIPLSPSPPPSAQSQISLLVNSIRIAGSDVTSINNNNNAGGIWVPMSIVVHVTAPGTTVEVVNDIFSVSTIQLVDITDTNAPVAYITIKQLA